MSDDQNGGGGNTPTPESGTGPQVINPMEFLDLMQESADPFSEGPNAITREEKKK